MADPLAIVSVGLEVIKGILWYYKGLEGFTEDISSTCQTLQTLQRSLELIKPYLTDQSVRIETRQQICACAQHSNTSISKLQAKLNKIQPYKRPSQGHQLTEAVQEKALRALYPFRRSTLAKLSETAIESQDQLHVALTVLGVDKSSSVSNSLNRLMSDTRMTQMLDWLPSINFTMIKDDLLKNTTPGTGSPFLTASDFLSWKQAHTSTLYCSGLAGAGKTMISSIAIAHLEQGFSSEASYAVCYLFCNYKLQTDDLGHRLSASLLSQLIRQLGRCPQIVEQTWNRHLQQGLPSTAEYLSMLREVLTSFTRTYLVIDALDEYHDDNHTLSDFLTTIFELQSTNTLNVMVTTRPLPEISCQFQDVRRIEIVAAPEDIGKYLHSQSHKLGERVRSNGALLQEIQDAILTASSGLFLLAKLHMDSVLDAATTPSKARKVIKQLPTGLKAFELYYRESMTRIQHQSTGRRQLALQTLCWLSFSLRRLSVPELVHALAVDNDNVAKLATDDYFDEDLDEEDVPEIELVLSVCAGMVIINEASNTVDFAHFTVQEFFVKYRDEWFQNGHAVLCNTCIQYLSYENLIKGDEHQQSQYWLRNYAGQFWGTHAKLCQYRDCRETTFSLLQDERRCEFVASFLNLEGFSHNGHPALDYVHSSKSLFLVANFGMDEMVKPLVGSGKQINADSPDSSGPDTPLLWAVNKGHLETTKELIKFGALITLDEFDYDYKDTHLFNHSPLSIALLLERWDILEYFLAPDQMRHISPNGRICALKFAATNGNIDIVQSLLGNSPSMLARSAGLVSAAAQSGNQQLVAMLLELGADVNDNTAYGNTILSACGAGNLSMVHFLQERGAQIPVSGLLAPRTLAAACYGGIMNVVEVVTAAGIGIDTASTYRQARGTPLGFAIMEGQTDIVRFLLDRGASTDASVAKAEDVLRMEPWDLWNDKLPQAPQDEIIFALRELGQTKFPKQKEFGSAIQYATLRGRTDYVTMMLDKGGNVNSQGGCVGPLLQVASRIGQTEMVWLLLKRGSDVNAPAGPFGTALQAAISHGHVGVEGILREHGATQ